jgi:hypothetical protein
MAQQIRFSQRVGAKPVKEAIQLKSIDDALRNGIWNVLTIFCWSKLDHYDSDSKSWDEIERNKGGIFFHLLWRDFYSSRWTGCHTRMASGWQRLAIGSLKPNGMAYTTSWNLRLTTSRSSTARTSSCEKATLDDALRHLAEQGRLHPALRKAFGNLYGYTSDANGIRHALMEESTLGFSDAKFMLVCCSAFVNFLVENAAV